MFCHACGAPLAIGALVCSGCGTFIHRPGSDVAAHVRAASADAVTALRIFAINPVGGLRNAFQTLGPQRAMLTGIVFGILYDVCSLLGAYLLLERSLGPFAGSNDEIGFKIVVKLVLLGFVPLLAVMASSLVTRKLFRGGGSVQGDVFIAGASILPAAVIFLLAGIIGAANFEVIAVLTVLTACYTILILFTGATRISAVSEAAAVPAVALILLATLWIARVAFTAVMF